MYMLQYKNTCRHKLSLMQRIALFFNGKSALAQ